MTGVHTNGRTDASRSWSGVQRGQRKRPVEWMIERGICLVSLSAILMVFLIFFFVGREALPIVFGQESSAAQTEVFRVEWQTRFDAEETVMGVSMFKPGNAAVLEISSLGQTLRLEPRGEKIQPGPCRDGVAVDQRFAGLARACHRRMARWPLRAER